MLRREESVFGLGAFKSDLTAVRSMFIPSQIKQRAPSHFNAVNASAEAASRAPRPMIARLIEIRSPQATAATAAQITRRPPVSVCDRIVRMVGPGRMRISIDAAAKKAKY